jgi:signal transduction histidine kinase/ActR/RegA family two-component response regulator
MYKIWSLRTQPEPPPPLRIHLDPEEAARARSLKARRYNVVLIPRLRVLGYGFVAAIVLLHNLFILPVPSAWTDAGVLSLVFALYAGLSWLMLWAWFGRTGAVHLGDVFLVCDLVLYLAAIYVTGGEKSWLFFLLLGRTADQANTRWRRALFFAHASTAAYVLLLVYLGAIEQRALSLPASLAMVAIVYAANLYLAFVARAADDLRGRLAAAVRVARDLIQEIQTKSAELESRVQERTAELRQANDALREEIAERERTETEREQLREQLHRAQRLESLGTLAGGVAHDFGNLLLVIAARARMLLADETSAAARHGLEQIELACKQATAMTRQLLTFSRHSVVKTRSVNLNTVLSQSEPMLRRAVGEAITVTIQADPDLHCVKADEDQLTRVLMNLVINARDAMPQGGTLHLETRNVIVDDARADGGILAPPGSYVVLVVRDTGGGMTAEAKRRLFEPFYTTKAGGRGTGLGLSVVDGVVRHAGGCIDVQSEVGRGTAMTVYLPALGREEEVDAERDVPRSASRGTETVLLVEDQDDVREVIQAALEKQGYTVLPAAGGDAALAIARADGRCVDLVLTDIVMPGLSGRELAVLLREQQADLPVLFMSGHTVDAVIRHGIATDSIDFLPKPFSVEELAAKVREVLDRNRAA